VSGLGVARPRSEPRPVFLYLSPAASRSPRAVRRAAWLQAATADDYITAAAAVGIDS